MAFKFPSLSSIVAVGGAMAGSAIMASNIQTVFPGINVVAYILFLLSSIASIAILKPAGSQVQALIYINLYYVVVNTVGIIRFSFP